MIEIKHEITGAVLFRSETAKTIKAAAIEANLRSADLRSADLRSADLRSANLRSADLRYADLSYANLRSADLSYANLRYADLSYADLSYADLSYANLRSADLRSADLRSADLSYADGLPEAPIIPRIDAKILEAIKAGGVLDMSKWHKCETTHCRAGWAITLAGKAGAELEAKTSSDTAGQLIYMASRPGVKVPDFYADTDAAMADLEKCAAEQMEAAK